MTSSLHLGGPARSGPAHTLESSQTGENQQGSSTLVSNNPAAPNTTHFVWVGKDIPAEDLLTAGHFSARGGNTQLWTDRPSAPVRVLASLHNSSAGSIDTSIAMTFQGQALTVSKSDHRAADERAKRWALNIRRADDAFTHNNMPKALLLRLDSIQAREGVGLGNPGRRSDVIRVAALSSEGGVYMDFDRAEHLRVAVSPLNGASKPEATPYPAIEGDIHTPNGFVCAQLNFPTMPQWFNNDILAGPAGSRGFVRYGQRIDAAYRMMDHTKDLMAALSDEKQARYLDAKAQLMETEKFGFHWPPMSLYAHTLVHQGFEEAIQDQPSAEISRPTPPSTLNDQMRGALIFRSALGTPDWQPEKLHTWLTFAATGPGALHHTAMQLTGARFPLADDFKNNEGIAKRFSVRLIELFNAPARGSWHNPQKPTSFDD